MRVCLSPPSLGLSLAIVNEIGSGLDEHQHAPVVIVATLLSQPAGAGGVLARPAHAALSAARPARFRFPTLPRLIDLPARS